MHKTRLYELNYSGLFRVLFTHYKGKRMLNRPVISQNCENQLGNILPGFRRYTINAIKNAFIAKMPNGAEASVQVQSDKWQIREWQIIKFRCRNKPHKFCRVLRISLKFEDYWFSD